MSLLQRLRWYWGNEPPYSLRMYRRDAECLLRDRLDYLRSLETPVSERFAKSIFRGLSGSELADPEYASKWSVLSRKRNCGVLLSALYFVAAQHDLDMTVVLAHRLLQGWVGRSVSNRILIRAFGHTGRTAAPKSEDWPQVQALVATNGGHVQRALIREKGRMIAAREAAWSSVRDEPRNS
jgi:hypothetical protein